MSPAKPSAGELAMAWILKQAGGIGANAQPEYRFHPTRRWRFDFAWVAEKVALEIEGGTWSGGRHTRGSGFAKDLEKYNEAGLAGWLVIRVTTQMVSDGSALALLERALK